MKIDIKHFALAAAGATMLLTSCIGDLDTLPLNPSDSTSETVYGKDENGYLAGLTKLYFNFVSNDTTDLQVGGVVRDEIEIEFGEPGQVAVLVFPVDGLRGRVGRVEGQGVEIPDARSEQHRCACRRQGEMFYVDFHGSFVFRSLHSDAANRCAGAARSSRRCR